MNDVTNPRPNAHDPEARRNYVIFCLVATLTMAGLVTAASILIQ